MNSANRARAILWIIVREPFRWFLALWFRVRVLGAENLPADGAAILFANHLSWFDIPVVACAISRQIRFMAKQELMSVPVLGRVIRWLGAFPVRRGQADRQAIKTALAYLDAGEVLGIFPEGTRSKTGYVQKPEPGVAYLAHKSGAPLVPVAISSTYRFRAVVTVRIAPPVRMGTFLTGKATASELEAASQRLMEHISGLLAPEHRAPDQRR